MIYPRGACYRAYTDDIVLYSTINEEVENKL